MSRYKDLFFCDYLYTNMQCIVHNISSNVHIHTLLRLLRLVKSVMLTQWMTRWVTFGCLVVHIATYIATLSPSKHLVDMIFPAGIKTAQIAWQSPSRILDKWIEMDLG